MATIEDFKKLNFVIAKIKEVKDHPNADKLFVLKVDIGSEERQLVAGIRSSYTADQLIGKQIVVIANLDPATIRGEESQGMLLATSDDKGTAVIMPEREVDLGSPVS